MATPDINRLMDQLRIRLPGALDGTIQLELFAVMNEFFQSSNAWREEIEFDVEPGELVYDVTPSNIATINRLILVQDADGKAVVAKMSVPGTIELLNPPNKAETWTATVALTVTDPTDREGFPVFPDWFLNKYGNDILDGVLGRMMGQIAKTYSQPQMAMYHMRRFMGAISQAKSEAEHGNVYRGQNWKFPQTFTRRKARW